MTQTPLQNPYPTPQGLDTLQPLVTRGLLTGLTTAVNLSCNRLTSLRGLSDAAPRLRRCCVRRNALSSLAGVENLARLEELDAGGNRIASLAPLRGLTALTEVALHRNCIADAAELDVLKTLPCLERLSLAGNPLLLARAAPGGGRGAVLALLLPPNGCCARLEVLDAAAVSAEERAAARAPGARAEWGEPAAAPVAAFPGQHQQQQPRTSSAAPSSPAPEAAVTARDAVSLLPDLSAPVAAAKLPSSLPRRDPLDAALAAARKEPPVAHFGTRHAGGGGMPAVALRRNATASFCYASGALGAAADLDPGGGYRLIAMFDAAAGGSGSSTGPPLIALSADAAGGYAQYLAPPEDSAAPTTTQPTTPMALRWRRKGEGTHYSRQGATLASWGAPRRSGGGGGSAKAAAGAPPPEAPITVDLGGGLLMSLRAAAGECELIVALGAFDAGLRCLVLSQRRGATVVRADGSCIGGAVPLPPPMLLSGEAAIQREQQPEQQKQQQAQQQLPLSQGGPVGDEGQRQAEGRVTGPSTSATAVAGVAAAAATAGGDLAAVFARAQALMARTAAEERRDEERRQAALLQQQQATEAVEVAGDGR